MKTFACKDVGMDCDWKCQGANEQEVLRKVEEHGRKDHGMTKIDEELKRRIRSKIYDVKVA
jgi:predicted small metal-binding protein